MKLPEVIIFVSHFWNLWTKLALPLRSHLLKKFFVMFDDNICIASQNRKDHLTPKNIRNVFLSTLEKYILTNYNHD